jgi:hypothetical protein
MANPAGSFLPRFANVETLKQIAPPALLAFFEPFQDYFKRRGYELPKDSAVSVDYEALTAILIDPDRELPSDLAQRLYLVHEMATEECMQQLIEAFGDSLEAEGDDPTPADIAVQAFLKNRNLLEEKHAEQFLVRSRSFRICVSSSESPRKLPRCDVSSRTDLEREFDVWFVKNKRGPGSKIFVFPRTAEGELWFLVRHGLGMRREGTLNKGESSSIFFRPEVFDVVVYHREQNALILHITPYVKGLLELYRKGFGKLLFTNESYFSTDGNYSLQPLVDKGASALDCEGIDGIKSVSLHEIEIYLSKGGGVFYGLRGDDVFDYLEQSKVRLPAGRWNKAVLSFLFSDSTKERSVTVWPPSRASYKRDDDRMVVELFLKKNQFLKVKNPAKKKKADARREAIL